MPRRKAGWVPKLSHLLRRECGRVRFPGEPDVYLGAVGSWPRDQRRPPESIRREYEGLAARWLSGRANVRPARRQGGSWSCADVAEGYADSLKGRPSYQGVVNALRPVAELYGDRPAAEFDACAFEQCRQEHLRRGVTPTTANDYAARVKAAFRWAAKPQRKGCPASVALELSLVDPLIDEGQVPLGPAPEADVLAAAGCAAPVVTAMLRLQLYSGMRPGEVLRMRVGDLDRSGEVWLYRPRAYKSRRSAAVRAQGGRKVWLGPKAQAVLRPWLEGKAHEDAVFPSSRGRPFTTAGYLQAVNAACDRAGVPHFQPRQVRHTALTAVEAEFGSLDHAQAVGGHRNPSVTRRYAHAQDRLAKEAAARMG